MSFNVIKKKMTPSYFTLIICKALLIFYVQLYYNQMNLGSELDGLAVSWTMTKKRSILREYHEKWLYWRWCPLFWYPKVQKKRKSCWRSYWRTLRGALKTVFFLHSSDKKIIAKSAKKKKSGIRWPSMLLKENSVSKLFRRYLRQFKKPHWQPRALLF